VVSAVNEPPCGAGLRPGTLADWLARIERLHPQQIDMGLARVGEVASRLGLHLSCPVITVGGTNGKGSTCALLEAVLAAAGYRVATYTSPHLVRFNERARLAGASVDDATLVDHLARVEAARGAISLSYFEFTTLAILSIFQHARPDVAILEIGLGGRLDAVNAFDSDCALVTCIDIDHTSLLGTTREAIGWEKAHIYRPGRPAICVDPRPPASLLAHAQEIGARLQRQGADFGCAVQPQGWNCWGPDWRYDALPLPALRGANQLSNALGAIAALESLRALLPVDEAAIRAGLASAELPGRFQIIERAPTVILDVAHNPHAATQLARNLEELGEQGRTCAVLGIMADKDLAGVLAPLHHRIERWFAVDLPGERALPAAELARAIAAYPEIPGSRGARSRQRGPESANPVSVHPRPRAGLAAARQVVTPDDRILVFGSFLTVADILAEREELLCPDAN